ncbi:MAG: carboxypeptidase regulatory-like domain-containing protein [Thermoplasmata archaeon]|nr:carboxypeptidase regulatory-like domain-containing protein [Thermoplasmata archaeon]
MIALLAAALFIVSTAALPLPGHAGGTVQLARVPVGPSPRSGELPGTTTFPTPIHHVFTIFLENEELSSVTQNGPFEVKLAKTYASASHYYALCHPSAPNYLAVSSGATWQCGSDAVTSRSSENIGDLAQKAGLSWGGFFESMPSACDRSDAYPYIAHHNPFVYYPDVYQNASLCRAHDQSFTAWNSDVAAGTIPEYAFFAPNMTDDGHDTSTAYADHWLDRWLSPYLNASWFASSVWFVTWDEGTTNGGCCGFQGGHLFFAAVSPFSRGGAVVATNATHYSLLSTTEWLLGLKVGGCGHADNSSAYAPLKGLFNFSTTPPSEYALHGTVTSASDGTAIAGANVTLGASAWTTTDAAGDYSFTVPNGSYLVSAAASGFVAQSATVAVSGSPAVQNFALVAATAPEFPIVGTVTYALNGSPAVGAAVNLVGGASTLTTGGGAYALSAPNGSYALAAWQSGSSAVRVPVTVAGSRVVQNFSLERFLWNQSGTITDATTGQPVVGATVSVASGPAGITGGNVSGPAGEFRLSLANGSYRLAITAALYRPSTVPLTVAGAPSPLGVMLARLVPVFSIYGQVQFGNGTPAPAGVELLLNSSTDGTTTANGSFSLWASNGSYVLSARMPGWYSAPEHITVAGVALSHVLTLVPFTFLVSGTVRFANGTPVSAGVVRLLPIGLSTVTTPDGRYSFEVPNGTYSLTVTLGGANVGGSTIVVNGGAEVHDVSIGGAPNTSPPPGSLLPILPILIGGAAVVAVMAGSLYWRRVRRPRPPPPGSGPSG